MGIEPYEPIHVALCFALIGRNQQQQAEMLNRCSSETLARMLAVPYSLVYAEHEEFTPDDQEMMFSVADHVMGMLISKLDTSSEPF